jgi:Bacterial regulatory proteins, tetR family/Transcriptional regulator C-terminal region
MFDQLAIRHTETVMKPDRRTHRTRQILHESLLALTVERGYDVVTVQDVLDHARVARSTFYQHFRDKDDLLLGGFHDLSNALPGNLFVIAGADTLHPNFGTALFQHIDAQRPLVKALSGSKVKQVVLDHLRNIVIVEARAWLAKQVKVNARTIPLELLVQYVAGAIFGLLTWWIDHDFPCSADEVGIACQQLVTAGFKGVMEMKSAR